MPLGFGAESDAIGNLAQCALRSDMAIVRLVEQDKHSRVVPRVSNGFHAIDMDWITSLALWSARIIVLVVAVRRTSVKPGINARRTHFRFILAIFIFHEEGK